MRLTPHAIAAAVALLALGLLVLGSAAVAVRAYSAELADFRPSNHPVSRPSGVAGLDLLEDVSFRAGDSRIAGWYRPPAKPGSPVVVLLHGSGADRSQVVPQAALLARRGYGLLLFDWPGHGESEGRVLLGAPERAALEAGLDFLQKEKAVRRVGVFGFSLGAYIGLQVAAADERVAVLAVEGAPSDLEEQIYYEYRRWSPVAPWGALLALRQVGVDLSGPRPLDLVARLGPRPIFLIAGLADPVIPASMSQRLFDAARGPRELWLVAGGGHGDAREREPEEYARRLVDFFARTLPAD
ncbi:MAG TPA: alpha/beta fold hydrolase [Vicinamibacteria bacterium]|nr:alpha/beta fold hydrolase [Vicinamibacteria bacterium]